MTRTALLLFLSSSSTAVIHALIPDHWLPFVLLSRSAGWSERRAAALTALAGLLHVLVTLAAGGVTILAGFRGAELLASLTGRTPGFLGGVLLVVFGVSYGLWRHRHEARAHGAGNVRAGVRGSHVHAHGHLLERWFHGTLTPAALVLVIGMSPCALLVPVLFAAAGEGRGALLAAILGFASCTIGTMAGVTVFAMRGMRRIELPFFTRYGDLISGAVVSALGFLMMVHER